MINRTILVGRLTKDPELKHTQSGIAVTRFTLAVNRPFKNGEGDQEADFINCVAWRKQAENTANFLRKGSLTGVDGRIQTSNFEGQDGNRVFMTEVVADSVQFLEPKNSRSDGPQNSQNQQQGYQTNNSYTNQGQANERQGTNQGTSEDPFQNGRPVEVTDDDLPF
ncbi:single-stranded DNA-binding protein [Sporosarcina sp. A2]|uniref:single-stranded DNA-binding protein n=1 Tax=Sporosarcina sp. A2 TaxID=3393449 RepID=UPI003D791362